ncbi:MAG: alkaline phosphatase family protein [Thermodesulfobacteriota bacterium]
MLKSLFKKKGPKALIIGLDGVPYSMLKDYIAKGELPNLKQILEQGFDLNRMDASIPDVSSTSWTSFMTGVNPGEHGIYGFMDLRPNSYNMYFPNSENINAPAFWDILGKSVDGRTSTFKNRYEGKIDRPYRSIVINIPQTYPAKPLNGILTAGFVALDLKKATYPDSAFDYLNSIGYVIDVDAQKARDQKDSFIKELFDVLDKRGEAIRHFMTEEPWDLFIATITETDRLHHFFFDAAMDEDHQYHESFRTFYNRLDSLIGELYDMFLDMTGGEGFFMTMSDHGFVPLEKEVYINNYLKEQGLLKTDEGRDFFDKIDYGTKVFAMEPARIYINMEGKYPRGFVKESERGTVIKEIKEALMSFKDEDSNHPVKEVHERDGLYSGPMFDVAPDLICLPNDGYDLKATLQKQGLFGKEHFTGMHTQYDAHCILAGQTELSKKLHIEDLSGIILDYFC